MITIRVIETAANYLKDAKEMSGLTWDQIALMSGVTRFHFMKFLENKVRLSIPLAKKLGIILKCNWKGLVDSDQLSKYKEQNLKIQIPAKAALLHSPEVLLSKKVEVGGNWKKVALATSIPLHRIRAMVRGAVAITELDARRLGEYFKCDWKTFIDK